MFRVLLYVAIGALDAMVIAGILLVALRRRVEIADPPYWCDRCQRGWHAYQAWKWHCWHHQELLFESDDDVRVIPPERSPVEVPFEDRATDEHVIVKSNNVVYIIRGGKQ